MPVADPDGLKSAHGTGSGRVLVPAVLAVVVIGLIGAVAVFGLPGAGNTVGNASQASPTDTPFPSETLAGTGTQPGSVAATTVMDTPETSATTAPVTAVKADFSVDKTTGPLPLTVSFRDASTGSPDTWYWDFGDGTHLSETNPVHVFKSEGRFTVALSVEKNGQASSKTQVISTSPRPPVANFEADITSGTAPLTVRFTDTSTGSPTIWFWEFGNGRISYDQHPEITYHDPGSYQVQLTVDRGGVKDKKSMTVTVNSVSSFAPVATTPATPMTTSASTAAIMTTNAPVTTVATLPAVTSATTAAPVTKATARATTAVPVTTTTKAATTTVVSAGMSFEGDWRDSSGLYFWFLEPEGSRIRGGWEFGEIAGEDSGSFTGTLSKGGTVVSGSFETMYQGGLFQFTMINKDHFSGYMDSPSGKITVSCTRMGG
jgi:PKD repeat protein